MTGFLAVALAQNVSVDTAYPAGGSSSEEWRNVPAALSCFDVQLSGTVGMEQQFEVIASNGCAFVVEVRELECTEDSVAADHDGCARLELQRGGAGREGLPYEGGDRDDVFLEWFDPSSPEVVATGEWGLGVYHEGGGGSWDSGGFDSGGSVGTRLGRRCGCSTGAPGLVLGPALLGLLAVRRRRS